MKYFVYIIQSLTDSTYYKGYTADVVERLRRHNSDHSKYTSSKKPWKLVYVEELETKTDALKRERQLKKLNKASIENLILSEINIVESFE